MRCLFSEFWTPFLLWTILRLSRQSWIITWLDGISILVFISRSRVESITALFSDARTLNYKSQLTFVFFAAVNSVWTPLRKQKFTSTSWKFHGFNWWISICFVCFKWVNYLWLTATNKPNCSGWCLNYSVRVFLKSAVKYSWERSSFHVCFFSLTKKLARYMFREFWLSHSGPIN